jgi:hypothetical protein
MMRTSFSNERTSGSGAVARWFQIGCLGRALPEQVR